MVGDDTNLQNDLQTRILDAAHDLIAHYGYDKTTVDDIARQAGVAKSTIYLRWKKKDDLFEAVLWREARSYTLDWLQRIEADPDGGTYGGFMRHALEALFDHPLLTALYRRDRQMLGRLVERLGIENIYKQRYASRLRFFQALQAVGVVRQDLDAATFAYVLNIFHFGLIQMIDVMPDEITPPTEQTLAVLVEMVDRMVKPEDGGNSDAGKAVIREFVDDTLEQLDALDQQ